MTTATGPAHRRTTGTRRRWWGATGARTSATGRSRVLALDGLRAFALLIIMGYHFGVGWLQGGFFSLDIFYVLSGYLITGLLLGEWARAARIKLAAFWLRRARRLLPALLVVLVVVALVVRFAYPPGLYPDFRLSALSALFYFSNWWQIASAGNYFVATGAVSPLTHTWSLAVEEQFYLVWPLVVVAVLHLAGSFARGIKALLAVSAIGAALSALEMAFLYSPTSNTTRLYFGTDTHAQSILVGAVLACTMTMIQRRRGLSGMAPEASSPRARVVLTVVGLAGFGGTLALTYSLTGTQSFDYHGGFLLSALSAAAIIIGAVCVAGGPIAWFLSLRPMVWMGTVSYGAYLWHYPVFIELDGARTGMSGLGLLTLRFVVTFTLAGLSYYLVERPVMEGTFWRSLKAVGPAVALMGVTVAVVVAATVAPATAAVDVRTRKAVSAAEHQALASANAFTTDPIRFLLVGDSLSVTLAIGLRVDTVPNYGVDVIGKGVLGCDFDVLPGFVSGMATTTVSTCTHWQTLWAHQVAQYRPEVVGILMGRWDITNQVLDGRIVSIGQPAWDRHLEDELDQAVQITSAHGAKVVLFTMPYVDPSNEAANGSTFPENEPVRTDEWNQLIEDVAARHPGVVTVVPLERLLDPQGRFQPVVGGVTVRWADGIHITKAGGEWLQPQILPTVAQLGLEARASG